MGMRPSDFWDQSFHEFYAAIRGFQRFNGDSQSQPLKRDELKDLMERYPD